MLNVQNQQNQMLPERDVPMKRDRLGYRSKVIQSKVNQFPSSAPTVARPFPSTSSGNAFGTGKEAYYTFNWLNIVLLKIATLCCRALLLT